MTALVAKFVSRAVERYREAKLQYPSQIVDYEVPLIRQALEKSQCGKTPLTLIVVNRAHHIRLIPREANERARASEQNIKPGCVIDRHLVHPRYCEFYLNSHKALQVPCFFSFFF
ncbi:unnamed protein product [Gongylonema pulchrum]|uniref:Piwi domain-containing protein n=1 Tax=Gongylonema pulchrum TaxID=637853 RepID=A0A183DGH3_9BILA|nr:unnamed protein product [Gongylonema pulchrum]